MENLLTVKQLVEIVPFAKWTINRMCREKDIPHYRINGKCFFDQKKIKEWLEKNEVKVSKISA